MKGCFKWVNRAHSCSSGVHWIVKCGFTGGVQRFDKGFARDV